MDSFYKNFPSLNENSKENRRSREGKSDYLNYMQKYNIQKEKDLFSEPHFTKDASQLSPKQMEYLSDPNQERSHLKHSQLVDDLKRNPFEGQLHDRSLRENAERNRKKLQYQSELMIQIDQKRKEHLNLKENERRAEEQLTRRLEQQLKAIQLEDQKREHLRLLNEKKLSSRVKPKVKNIDNMIYMEKRQIQSLNDKPYYNVPEPVETSEKSPDNQIYRYFSDSAKYDDNLKNYGRVKRPMHYSTNLYESEDLSDSYHDDNDNHISGHVFSNQKLFGSACSHNNEHKRSLTNGNSTERICLMCLLKQNGNLQHNVCPNCINSQNCIDCHKPLCYKCKEKRSTSRNVSSSKIVEITEDEENQFPELMIKTISPRRKTLQDVIVRQDSSDKPYSLNIQPTSIFNPHTNLSADEIEALRKYNEQKISSYIKNYGDLKFTKEKRVELAEKVKVFPIPAPRRSKVITKKVELVARAEVHKKNSDVGINNSFNNNSNSSSNDTNNNYTTFTQLGFAKKHLMLEKYTDF
ncbi:unnamed protein product [Diamesa hyperborea]